MWLWPWPWGLLSGLGFGDRGLGFGLGRQGRGLVTCGLVNVTVKWWRVYISETCTLQQAVVKTNHVIIKLIAGY